MDLYTSAVPGLSYPFPVTSDIAQGITAADVTQRIGFRCDF